QPLWSGALTFVLSECVPHILPGYSSSLDTPYGIQVTPTLFLDTAVFQEIEKATQDISQAQTGVIICRERRLDASAVQFITRQRKKTNEERGRPEIAPRYVQKWSGVRAQLGETTEEAVHLATARPPNRRVTVKEPSAKPVELLSSFCRRAHQLFCPSLIDFFRDQTRDG